MNPRLKKIYTKLERNNLDALIITSAANISYLTGYLSRDSQLVISRKSNIYFTDGRYFAEAKKYLSSFKLKRRDCSFFKAIGQACNGLNLKRVGFEEGSLSFLGYTRLREQLKRNIDLIPTLNLAESLREIKSREELTYLGKATDIAAKALEFTQTLLSAGIREVEIAAELERFIRYNGASSSAFDIIVASGPNSSYPHHLTSQRRLKENEVVLVDLGVDYFGYKSDLTRVFFLGKINPLAAKIYALVCRAQERAIARIRPGKSISAVDQAARQYIAKAGYGRFFSHSLGHGIGLEIHEGPNISSRVKDKLKRGMVFTVEPAVYLPGKLGIRIEDMVRVTEKGVEVLSGALDK